MALGETRGARWVGGKVAAIKRQMRGRSGPPLLPQQWPPSAAHLVGPRTHHFTHAHAQAPHPHIFPISSQPRAPNDSSSSRTVDRRGRRGSSGICEAKHEGVAPNVGSTQGALPVKGEAEGRGAEGLEGGGRG